MPVTAEDLEQEFQEEQAKRAKVRADAETKFNEDVRVPRICRWLLGLGTSCALLILVLPWPAHMVRLNRYFESDTDVSDVAPASYAMVQKAQAKVSEDVPMSAKQVKSKGNSAPFKSAGDVGRKNGEAAYKWIGLPKVLDKKAFMDSVQNLLAKRNYFPDCCPMAVKTVKRATKDIRTLHWEMQGYLWGDRHPQYLTFLLVAHAIADYIPAEGLILEFGVASGGSITLTAGIMKARQDKRTVYGFDTFTGLPEDWGGFKKGAFAYDKAGKLPPVPKGVVLIKGLFSATLAEFLGEHADTAAFINIDCDLYQGAIDVLRALAPRMRPGTILHFHELYQSPFADELKALCDFLEANSGIRFELLNVYAHGEAALIRVASVASAEA